ncbi:MAG TPA: hypothetical protein VFE50_13165 [Cyclobacteriaceae bacterium]|nr:hypothetical protein [Cyclobacteriaceae bacterium]
MNTRLLILMLVIGLTACEENELESGPVIFTFRIDQSYYDDFIGSVQTTWIVLHDNETGEYIGAQAVEAGEAVEFRGTLSGQKIAVSHLQAGTNAFWEQYCHVDVYNSVDAGSNWTLSQKNSPERILTNNPVWGEYSLSINNVPPMYGFSVSNGLNGSDFARVNGDVLTGTFYARKDPSPNLVVIDPEGSAKPKYVWTNSVSKNASIQLDYNQFIDFDTYLNVKFPSTKNVNARVESLDSNSYTFYYNFHWGRDKVETNELHIGMLNSFSRYNFSLEIDDFQYRSRGPAPQSINVSTDTSNYAYKVTSYDIPLTTGPAGATSYSIVYYSPPGSAEHEPLTRALEDAFRIDMSKMKRGSSNIVLTGQTYADKLRLKFDPEFKRPETYQVSWIGPYFSPF